jgi:radical SAM C-methyltransferase
VAKDAPAAPRLLRPRKRSVWLVQQGVWDMPKESMPLAVGYLKAAALADDAIRDEMELRIFNFNGGDSVTNVAEELFSQGRPDILAFSVLGWNYYAFGHLAETFKQLVPGGWVVFGGNHVANQGARVFRQFPAVDVVVNTEGEFVFRELLLAYLAGRSPHELHYITGISFPTGNGQVCTTPDRERIQDLDTVPSPFLSGAIPLTDRHGEFRYDVALIETNRGCPYKCAFCYWGGAVGQKMRSFSRARLQAELEIFAYHKVHTIVLCDSNFGMQAKDLEFMEDVIRTRERFGYPRAVEGSWAKNKSKVFYEIVRRMKAEGMQSSFTLALQTLNDSTLEQMQRRNMKLNEWEDLVHWLRREGMDCYAELIWGAPGETPESFFEGYDRLARYMTRIAVYPLLLLPNTEYANARERFGFTTVRGEHDDFEYVLSNNTMTIEQNLEMKQFILWARSMAEHLVFRHIWTPLRELAGMTQSMVVRRLLQWFDDASHPAAVRLAAVAARVRRQPSAVPTFLREFYGEPAIDDLLAAWWREVMAPDLPAAHADFLTEVFHYDCLTRPIFDMPGAGGSYQSDLEIVEVAGEQYYCRPGLRLGYDVPGILRRFQREEEWQIEPRPNEVTIYCKAGFHQYYANHEEGIYFAGQTEEELREAKKLIEPKVPPANGQYRMRSAPLVRADSSAARSTLK